MSLEQIILSNQYLRFLIILFAGSLSIGICYFIIKCSKIKINKKKKEYTKFIIDQFSGPLYLLIIFIVSYYALRNLSFFNAYETLIKKIFFSGGVLIGAFFATRISNILVVKWLKIKRGMERTPELLSKITGIVVLIISLLMILAYFQVDITPLIATVGLGTVVVA